MSSDGGVQAILAAARRVAEGTPLTGQLLSDAGVPVALRLVVTAAALSGADRPVNKRVLLEAAPAARSAAYRDNADVLDAAVTYIPALVSAQLDKVGSAASATDLARQLQHANHRLAEERRKREEAERQLEHVASYARELHWRLKSEHDALLAEQKDKVVQLRPLPPAPSTDSS